MNALPDDPSTLFLLGVIATMVGFWAKSQVEAFTSANRKVESKADNANKAQSDIRVDMTAIEGRIDAFEKRLENHDKLQEMVTRLDERMSGLVATVNRQPETIALCVGEAMKAAFAAMKVKVVAAGV